MKADHVRHKCGHHKSTKNKGEGGEGGLRFHHSKRTMCGSLFILGPQYIKKYIICFDSELQMCDARHLF